MRLSGSSGRVGIALAAIIVLKALAPISALAQSTLPPASIPGGQGDAASLEVRLERLENQLRAANGAIEELQNQQQKLQEQLKRFQEDVEFRLNGGARPSAALQPAPAPAPAPVAAANPVVGEAPASKPAKRSDAFDPSTEPDAVGAPKQLGTTAASAPLEQAPAAGAPLDLGHPAPPTGPLASTGETPEVIPGITGPTDAPREQFNAAMDAFRAGQYDQAETQLRAFLAHNAGNRLAPDATFYLGESYLQRSRPREAAEQYLKLSTDYAKSPRAPEGMLRLGESLAMLGNNEQACATFSEVNRRYPTAAGGVKKSLEREMQKDHC